MAMDKIINANFDKAFSDSELTKLCDDQVSIVPYDELYDMEHIDEAFDGKPAIALLYLTGKNFGHWVAVINHKDNIEVFNPYGLKIDEDLNYISPKWRHKSHQDEKHLTRLLKNQEKPVIYNDIKLQRVKENIATCGRWVGTRIVCRDMPLDYFIKIFTDKKNKFPADYYITCFTMFI